MKHLKKYLMRFIILVLILPVKICVADEPILVIDPKGHSGMIRDVMFTPDGTTLISVSDDKTIRLWDVETGELIQTIRGQIGKGHEGKLFAGALSPDGKTLAVGGYGFKGGDRPIHFYNIQSGEQIGLVKGHTNSVVALAFTADGKRLASGSHNKTVRIWDVSLRKEITTLKGHTDYVYGVAFSPDGQKVVSASFDETLRLWNIREMNNLSFKEMKAHTEKVRCVAFAPNGRYIVSGGWDGQILLWDGKGNFLKRIDEWGDDIDTLSISANSKKMVAVTSENFNAYVYSIPSGEKLSKFSTHDNSVVASTFYGNDLIATAGGAANDIYIWSAVSGTVKTHILGKGKRTLAIAFGEGLKVAFGNTVDYISDSMRGPLEQTFDFSGMSLDRKPPDKKGFRCTQPHYLKMSFKKVGKYELDITGDGKIQNDDSIDGWINCYTFTPNGHVVVGSSFSLKRYRSDGTLVTEFIGHTGVVWAVSIDPSGRILASASDDQTVKLWNLKSGVLLATLFVTTDKEWICWTPKGYYAASAGGEKYIGWQINQGIENTAEYYPVYTFRKRFHIEELVTRTIEWASFDKAFAEYNRRPGKKIQPQKITQVLPPEVTWLSPDNYYTKTSTNTIRIKAQVRSDVKITTLKVQVNGGIAATPRQLKTTSGGREFDKMIEATIPLMPKKNTIRIYAENKNALTTSKERIVFYKSQEWQKPNLNVVAIGISNYSRADQNLSYAENDARAISRLFLNQKGKLFRNVKVKSLYNKKATRAAIINALRWLEENTTQKDVAVLFVAAHGYNEREAYYILPYDGDPKDLMLTGVDKTLIERTLGNLPSRVLLFLDTCHSGQLGADLYASRGRVDNTEALRELASPEYGMVIMAASTAAEISQERPEWKHGAFTKALIEGLEGGKADQTEDGIIYLTELDHYLSERVKKLTGGKQHANMHKTSSISRFPIYQVK